MCGGRYVATVVYCRKLIIPVKRASGSLNVRAHNQRKRSGRIHARHRPNAFKSTDELNSLFGCASVHACCSLPMFRCSLSELIGFGAKLMRENERTSHRKRAFGERESDPKHSEGPRVRTTITHDLQQPISISHTRASMTFATSRPLANRPTDRSTCYMRAPTCYANMPQIVFDHGDDTHMLSAVQT